MPVRILIVVSAILAVVTAAFGGVIWPIPAYCANPYLNYSNPCPAPVPANFFADHLIAYTGTFQSSDFPSWPPTLGALGKCGLTSWTYIEQSRGVYDWSYLDACVTQAQAHGLSVYWTFDGTPMWSTSNTGTCAAGAIAGTYFCGALPTSMSDLTDFVTALVTRYKGQIVAYDLFNEPYNCCNGGIAAADLVTWSNAIIPIIRSIDPAAKITTPDFYGPTSYFTSYYGDGGPTNIDVVSLHGYPSAACFDVPEAIDATWGSTSNPALVTTNLYAYLSVIQQYGLQNLSFWDTEGSWGVDPLVPTGTCGTGAALSSTQQAMYVARSLLLHWSNNISRYYWYAYTTVGTLNNDSPIDQAGVNAAGIAYAQMQNWMTGLFMTSRCTESGTVWTCGFTLNSYQAIAVWDMGTLGYNGSSTFNVPNGYVDYCDIAGTYHNGLGATITITGAPVLFENVRRAC